MVQTSIDIPARLARFHAEAEDCKCRDACPVQPDARPLFHEGTSGRARVLLVAEAPNADDTFDPKKGHLTIGPNTDPTGQNLYRLLHDHANLAPEDVVLTNSVLCLPRKRDGRYPVHAAQQKLCLPWLRRLILDLDAAVVVAIGGQALRALKRIEPHQLTLRDAGRRVPWFGRELLAVYHCGNLGRVSRSKERQEKDWSALRAFAPTR